MATFDRRLFFRIPLNNHPGTMQVVEVGGRSIVTDPKPCFILNASGGGLRVVFEDDLQIRRTVFALFSFELGGIQFQFRGRLIRKLDDMVKFEYGIAFVDVDERQRSALAGVLGKLQAPMSR